MSVLSYLPRTRHFSACSTFFRGAGACCVLWMVMFPRRYPGEKQPRRQENRQAGRPWTTVSCHTLYRARRYAATGWHASRGLANWSAPIPYRQAGQVRTALSGGWRWRSRLRPMLSHAQFVGATDAHDDALRALPGAAPVVDRQFCSLRFDANRVTLWSAIKPLAFAGVAGLAWRRRGKPWPDPTWRVVPTPQALGI